MSTPEVPWISFAKDFDKYHSMMRDRMKRETYICFGYVEQNKPCNYPHQSEFSVCVIIIIIISKMHLKHFKLVKAFREKVKVFKRKENILFVVN